MNDWKVRFEKPVWGDIVDLYLFRHIADGEVECMTQDSRGQQILIRVKPMGDMGKIKPTLRIGGRDAGEILKAFAEAIHEQGVATDNDARLRGLLEATKEHLSDMRKLVFRSEEPKP